MKVKEEEVEFTLQSDSMLRQWVEPEDIKQDPIIKRQESSTDNESVDFALDYEHGQLSDGEVRKEYLGEEVPSGQQREVVAKSILQKDVANPGSNKKALKVRPKRNGHDETGKGNILSKILKELCQGAPEASGEVTNMCRFRCFQCNKDIRSWRFVCDHFWIEHSQRLSYHVVPKYISMTVCHICKICGERTLCDATFILRHLEKHDMNVGCYQKKFVFNMSNMLPDAVYSDKLIGNLCIYRCESCKQTFSSRTLFSRHLKSLSHGSALNVGLYLQKKVFHKCKICDKSILCDKTILYGHIVNTHGITFELYCKQTGCTLEKTKHFHKEFVKSLKESKMIRNACEFYCKICGITYNKVCSFRDHFVKHDIKAPGHLSDYLTKGSFYRCKMCHRHMLCDIKTVQYHMKIVHGTKLKQKNVTVVTSHEREYAKLYTDFTRNIPISSKVWKESAVPMSNIPMQYVTSKLGDLCMYSCPHCDS